MNLRQYFFMFRVRWRLALGIMLATVAVAVPVILMLPKQYTASTSLGVETKSPDAITTLRVAARPTPSVPPVVARPW